MPSKQPDGRDELGVNGRVGMAYRSRDEGVRGLEGKGRTTSGKFSQHWSENNYPVYMSAKIRRIYVTFGLTSV